MADTSLETSGNLKNLKILLAAMQDDHLTKEDFVNSFKTVVDQITKLKRDNETEFELLHQSFLLLEKKLTDGNVADFTSHKSEVQSLLGSETSRLSALVDAKIQSIDEKLATVVDGKDADEEQIVANVLAKIPPPLPQQMGEDFRNALEALQGEDRLKLTAVQGLDEAMRKLNDRIPVGNAVGWGAHPLNIYQSGTVKTKTARHINFTGATVTHGKDGVTTVAITGGAGGFTTLTPTETPNGVLKVFTFSGASAQPSFIISDNAQMQAVSKSGTVNWTWAAGPKQATMTIPPNDDIIGIV